MTKYTPIIDRPHPAALEGVGSGTQRIYRFPNGYGASVVQFMMGSLGGSYGAEAGLYELAVVAFNGESNDYMLTYTTTITDDVIGRLSKEEVDSILDKIADLPKNPTAFYDCVKAREESKAAMKKFIDE